MSDSDDFIGNATPRCNGSVAKWPGANVHLDNELEQDTDNTHCLSGLCRFGDLVSLKNSVDLGPEVFDGEVLRSGPM